MLVCQNLTSNSAVTIRQRKRWWPILNYHTGIFLKCLRKTTKYPIQTGCSAFWLRFQTGAFRKRNRSASHWIAIFGLNVLALHDFKFWIMNSGLLTTNSFSPNAKRTKMMSPTRQIFNVNYEVQYASKPVQAQTSSKLYYFKKRDTICFTNIIQLRFREIKFISSAECT